VLRRIAPTLGLVALLIPAASAQDIAKGVTLSGWVDTTSETQTNATSVLGNPMKEGPTLTNFGVGADFKVGWKANEQVSAVIDVHTASPVQGASFVLQQAYITLAPTEILTISAGTSYGPMGYYSPEPTGAFAVTNPLNARFGYGNNPTGVWATLTPNSKFNMTVLVADNIVGNAPSGAVEANRQGAGAFALDLVFTPVDEVMLNLEGATDVTGGGVDGSTTDKTSLGGANWVGFNGQYKKDALTVAGEVWFKQWQKTLNNGAADPKDFDDDKQTSAMGLVNYVLPGTPVPASVSAIGSYLTTAQEVGVNDLENDKLLKLTVALLTNPLSTDSFGLNFEVSYLKETPADSTMDSASSMLFAVEGLVQLK